ncbi:hypothetical protein HPB50_017587 [Hyalomma asiaticum]|uniref:Uncharacterized protein n=1 Tax=Hyalomma asiaticum TaxID=266040 RepID=A0ACB7SQZ5_HYAAI|nr:hypothetical protein HPB50_017587 [Hyalomma asiaticum]
MRERGRPVTAAATRSRFTRAIYARQCRRGDAAAALAVSLLSREISHNPPSIVQKPGRGQDPPAFGCAAYAPTSRTEPISSSRFEAVITRITGAAGCGPKRVWPGLKENRRGGRRGGQQVFLYRAAWAYCSCPGVHLQYLAREERMYDELEENWRQRPAGFAPPLSRTPHGAARVYAAQEEPVPDTRAVLRERKRAREKKYSGRGHRGTAAVSENKESAAGPKDDDHRPEVMRPLSIARTLQHLITECKKKHREKTRHAPLPKPQEEQGVLLPSTSLSDQTELAERAAAAKAAQAFP